MHTEINETKLHNMQLKQSHQQELSQHHQHYINHQPQDHVMPEQHNQVFTHLPSTTAANNISLSEGLRAPETQQHLNSDCLLQYYSRTSMVGFPPTSSSSSSSCSSSSSDESDYSRSKSPESQTSKNINNRHASIGVNLRVTGQCSQGGRKYMEDYFSVAYQQSENAQELEYAFIGIYDGHGGAEAAKFAKEHLMMEIINQKLFWSDNDHDVLRAIREGYIATHYAMWREQDKWPKTANGLPSTAGTTATVAFIRREKIFIGHVGDSGIVLGYQNENENFWRAKQLTIDHKPESVEERTRIMNSGGKVVVKSGVPRVVWNRPRNASHRGPIRKKTLIDEIPFLAVARSLGDLWSYNSERNEFVVSPDPDVKIIPIDPNTFRCLIFGTDGLWNVVSAQEAVNTVRDKEVINEGLLPQRSDNPHEGNQWVNPSKSLVEQALRTWANKKMRADNTSVVTVILYPPGQVDYYTEAKCKNTGPPPFLQPTSYGRQYTQVQSEVPAYEDATTCKEMALKYLPPDTYRNFNYYADDSDIEADDNEESEQEHNVMLTAKHSPGDLQQNTNYSQHFTTSNWVNNNNNTNNYTKSDLPLEEDEEEDEEDDEDEEELVDEKTKVKDVVSNERQVSIINFQNYMHLEADETNNATDSYINTFAESYNSILTASQDEYVTAGNTSSSLSSSSSNSNSNSNSNCQSVTPPNMHAILQEQQLYQQQCMSEEEGYSLTKLETRREQLTCKRHVTNHLSKETTAPVETFKIFHESQGHHSRQEPQEIELYHSNTERFYQQQQQFMPQIVPKPLELHSLLQQEREEEQQVAYERLQMENKLRHQPQNITDYACLQTTNSITTPLVEQSSMAMEVEYLEEESSVGEEDIIYEDCSRLQHDESIQINEISSSSGNESRMELSSSGIRLSESKLIEKIEKIEILPNPIFGTTKAEELAEAESEVFVNSCPYSPPTPSRISICHPPPPQTVPAPSTPAIIPLKSSLNHSKRTKSSYLYNNVPNENLQRISNSKYNHTMYSPNGASRSCRRSMCMTSSASLTTPPSATSKPIIQRQLRSTTTPCPNKPNATPMRDYSKRTLRTRNSLPKDMKAKSALAQSALKFPENAVTRNFLRTTAANFMVGKSMLINDLNVTPCNRISLGTANNVRTPNRNNNKTRREKTSVTINGSLTQSKVNIQNSSHTQLNLRSRQITSLPSSEISTPHTNVNSAIRSPVASTPVIKLGSLTERRILRSMHTRSASSKSSQTPTNFSKSTRTQSTGSNLAAPPPSPKLINAVSAVAAATRARSLLNAKHVSAANGTQSVVTAVFGKRTSLRINRTSRPAVLPTNAAPLSPSASTQQTLRGRRVKKLKR